MLGSSRLQTIVCTSRPDEAERFYSGTLGLSLKGRSMGAFVYEVQGSVLRVSPVPSMRPSEHTVLGFAVPDLDAVLTALGEKSLVPERIPGLPHDARGVVRAPDGSRVVWIRDPDGNLLSIVQYASP